MLMMHCVLIIYPGVMIFALQEKISEDLRATLNAFLYRTGEQSNKLVSYLIHCKWLDIKRSSP